MRNLTLCTILLVIWNTTIGYSQVNYSDKYGKITEDELSMTEYEPDKDAEAVCIYEIGRNYFQGDYIEGGFLLYMNKRTKIKILKQSGIEYANIEIPYYVENRKQEKIVDIEATVYNKEGETIQKTKLDTKNIFEEKINNNIYVKKIALSNVREGSVIEYQYKIVTPFFFHMRQWEFQKEIPVIHSQLTYQAIPYYEYTYILKGAKKFDSFTSKQNMQELSFGSLIYKEVNYKFEMNNLAAFKDEKFITSPKDYMAALDFQISRVYYANGGSFSYKSTWPELCKEFLKDDYFGKYLKASEQEGKKVIPSLDLATKSPIEKIQTISDYVKKMYNWNGINSKYSSDKLSKFINQKTGNAADINLYLIGLLKAAGIETNPVVLSTRDNGIITKTHPFQHFLNYVIAEVNINDQRIYIDATEPMLQFNELPERCANVEAIVIKPKTPEWVMLTDLEEALTEKTLNIVINPDNGKMHINAFYKAFGQNAYNYQKAYLGKEGHLKDYLQKKINIPSIPDTISIEEKTVKDKSFNFAFKYDLSLDNTGEKLFIQPFANLSIQENPFKQSNRKLPVDLVYIRGAKFKSRITIPEGYKVEYLPKTIKNNGSIVYLSYSAQESDNTIEIDAEYSFKNNMYEASSYQILKNTVDLIIKQFSDMIVLRKIKGVS